MTKNAFSWVGKKVFVTGAGGFIGSHLVETLVLRGAEVRCLVRYNSQGTFGWLNRIPPNTLKATQVVQGDLRDADSVLRAVQGTDIVFHLGAMISIPYSYVSPSEAVAVNVEGTRNVLNACRYLEVDRLVHTSTSEVYGTAIHVPIDEKHPLQGQSPYSASKIGADQLVDSYYRSFDLPAVTIRPFNTYGPRQSARAVIPTIIAQLLADSDIRLGNLEATRDFTYVQDTVDGMLLGAEVDGAIGRTINLGYGTEIKIGALLKELAAIIGKQPKLVVDPERIRPQKSEVNRLLSNNALAKEILGWRPRVTPEEGFAKTVAWFKDNLVHYQRAQTQYVV